MRDEERERRARDGSEGGRRARQWRLKDEGAREARGQCSGGIEERAREGRVLDKGEFEKVGGSRTRGGRPGRGGVSNLGKLLACMWHT